jgi:hypothetical protein
MIMKRRGVPRSAEPRAATSGKKKKKKTYAKKKNWLSTKKNKTRRGAKLWPGGRMHSQRMPKSTELSLRYLDVLKITPDNIDYTRHHCKIN